ncbi:MAG: hypothetical protein KC800_11475, partial [Candidatus Eremiobacteraeota bacterium]|nr:hypothetical protein [Candidatus Eremiobacteraeota bacterium]
MIEKLSRTLWRLVAALIWAGVGLLAAFLYTPTTLTMATCAAAGFFGVWMSALFNGWRLSAVASAALFLWLALQALGIALQSFEWAAMLLGPTGAYKLAVTMKFGTTVFVLSTLLRAFATKKPLFLVGEGALIALLVTKAFSGHRQGHIDRPYFLVDPLWSQGYDPLPFFMAIGAATALLVVVLAMSGNPQKRTMRDLCLALVVVGGLYLVTPIRALQNLPKPPTLGEESEKVELEQRYADSDTPNFEDRNRNRANAPMAVVLFEQDYTPSLGFGYYFRQRAYSLMEGDQLKADPSGRFDKDVPEDFPTDSVVPEQVPQNKEEGQIVETTVCLLSEHSRPFGLTNPVQLDPALNPDTSRFRMAYKVRSFAPELVYEKLLSAEVGSPEWDEETLAHYLKMPSNPKYQELADELRAEISDEYRDKPVVRAIKIFIWLGEEGTYCLHTKHSKAEDPVASFLFGDRTGYCVYFAHAACFLYRAMGVPSRVAGGYCVPAENRNDGPALLVGSRYAHAWPEIYIRGLGWVPLDVTPENTLEEPFEPPDPNLQRILGELARQAGTEEDLPGMAAKRNLRQMAGKGLRATAVSIPVLLLGAFLLMLLGKAIHLRRALSAAPERRAVTVYRAVLQRLAEFGFVREQGETRTEFARRVGD